jgi:hypothetical protein
MSVGVFGGSFVCYLFTKCFSAKVTISFRRKDHFFDFFSTDNFLSAKMTFFPQKKTYCEIYWNRNMANGFSFFYFWQCQMADIGRDPRD